MKEALEFTAFLTIPCALFALIIGGCIYAQESLNARSCRIYTEETGIETKYRSFDECYLKTPSGWMPWSEYKVRAVAQEQPK